MPQHADPIRRRNRATSLTLALALAAAGGPSVRAAPGDPLRDRLADALVADALPAGNASTGRSLFEAALAGDAFESGAVGPFDVHVAVADGLSRTSKAKKVLARALDGLAPAADALGRWFPGDDGVVAGRRFPIVLVSSRVDDGEQAFDEVLALLDRCEDEGYSGFKPDLPVFTPDNRQADDVFTWEVLCCNLAHDEIARDETGWLEHGLGYAALNLVTNRLFARGTWGPPPPWLKEGLVDELDIEAYGEAWVAAGSSTSTSSSRKSWTRKGWEGFVPEGQQPPPPVLGPPPGLRTKTLQVVLEDAWLARRDSRTRHWKALLGDRRSDVPASFRDMAAGQTYTPRDRAYSRCVLHLALDASRDDDGGPPRLLAALDVPSRVARSGMRDGEPLALAFARALGGVPGVEALQERPLGEFLVAIGREDLVGKIERLGGSAILARADHREQADWLWGARLSDANRQALFRVIVEAEAWRQLQQWEVLGDALDRGATAAFEETAAFPEKDKARSAARAAFLEAFGARS